jgi:hypothetical protein
MLPRGIARRGLGLRASGHDCRDGRGSSGGNESSIGNARCWIAPILSSRSLPRNSCQKGNMRKPASTAVISSRIDIRYGLYRIIARQQGKECRAVAYLGDKQRMSFSGDGVDEAVSEIRRLLDERTARLSADRMSGVPGAEEFLDAFESIRKDLPPHLSRVLRLHCSRPGHAATFSDLARLSGLSTTATEAEYARLGRQLGTLLSFRPAPNWLDRSLAAILVLANPLGEQDVRSPFELRPPVVAALSSLF